MGSEPKTVPKLSLFSLTPSQSPEPSGMLTPPLRSSASVPFLWEEAPGKPRENDIKPKNSPVRSLELPPRLLAEIKVTSPTTVLDGPEVGRSMSFTFSYRRPNNESWGKRLTREKVGYFGSARWGSFRKNKEAAGGNLDFFSNGGGDFCGGATGGSGGGGGAKVKITRVRKRGSFLSISNSKAHFLASIYENIKERVPWRRKQEKQRKMG